MELPDYLPISMLNQLEYCERRFWLMFVQGEMAINAPLLEGTQQHERAHSGGMERDGEVTLYRRVYLWSDRLRVTGFADVIEEQGGEFVPVEYKHGKMGRWFNDQVQLCAQAMCLEERTGQQVAYGEIFYWRSRRRVQVELTRELRARTEGTVARAFELLKIGHVPPPLARVEARRPAARCHDCSLEEICLPREVLMLAQEPA